MKIKLLGEIDILPDETKEIAEAVKLTENNKGLQFNIALNYGGRAEILKACKSLIRDIEDGNLDMNSLMKQCFQIIYIQAMILIPT